jgi:hypothetical protein
MASGTNNATTMISLPIGYISLTGLASQKYGAASNKVPRRKQRGINCKLQFAFAPRCGELNPQRLMLTPCILNMDDLRDSV